MRCIKCHATFGVPGPADSTAPAPPTATAATTPTATTAPVSKSPPPVPPSSGSPPPVSVRAADEPEAPPIAAESESPPEKYRREITGGNWFELGCFGFLGLGVIATILLIVFVVRIRNKTRGGLATLNRVIVQQSNAGGWADASSLSMTDSFAKISVSQVLYGGVRAKAEGNVVVESKSNELLQIYVRIENVSSNKLPYQSWFGNSFQVANTTHQAELTDSGKRTYSMMSKAGFQSIQGHQPKAVLEPGEEISDVIVFSVPRSQLGNAQHFHLELPSLAYGGSKKSRFEIPRTMIKQ